MNHARKKKIIEAESILDDETKKYGGLSRLEWVTKNLSRRTSGKKYESYVANAIYNRLVCTGLRNIEIYCQKAVHTKSGTKLLDIYFPEINWSVEVDEGHHVGHEKEDLARREDIEEILNIDEEYRFKELRVTIFDKTGEECEYEDLESQINRVVDHIKSRYEQNKHQRPMGLVRRLTHDETINSAPHKISINDNIEFATIDAACNYVFGCGYKRIWFSYFQPNSDYFEFPTGYCAWFPKLMSKYETIGQSRRGASQGKRREWLNYFEDDEEGAHIDEFRQVLKNKKWKPQNHVGKWGKKSDNPKRVTFAQVENPVTGMISYRFYGVYERRRSDHIATRNVVGRKRLLKGEKYFRISNEFDPGEYGAVLS